MNRTARSCIGIILCITACSPAAEPAQPAESTQAADASAIRALREAFNEAQRAGDAERVAGFYTEDAVVLGPEEPTTTGVDAIRTATGDFFQSYEWDSVEPIDDLHVEGDWAYTRTTWSSTQTDRSTGAAIERSGKAVHIYRRQPDGTWKISVDIYNFDAPVEASS